MQTAGFVLAGGASSRMGRNKALLMLDNRTFIEIVAAAVQEAAGSVTIIGPPETYGHFGFPVIPDRLASAGPLAGVETALFHSPAIWNLVVACDMPYVNASMLRQILDAADAHPDAACVVPDNKGLLEPLCAAYHQRSLAMVTKALAAGTRKVTDVFPSESIHHLRVTDARVFENINTPNDWSRLIEPR